MTSSPRTSSPKMAGRAAEILTMRVARERSAVRERAEALLPNRNQRKNRKNLNGKGPQTEKKKNKTNKANNRYSNRELRRTVSPNKLREVLNAGKRKRAAAGEEQETALRQYADQKLYYLGRNFGRTKAARRLPNVYPTDGCTVSGILADYDAGSGV